jgi:hypothetical protein
MTPAEFIATSPLGVTGMRSVPLPTSSCPLAAVGGVVLDDDVLASDGVVEEAVVTTG